jgi:tetratricopeptide (TPR) repeat protein
MNVRYGLYCPMLLAAALFHANSVSRAQDVAAAARANRANHNSAAAVKAESQGANFVSISVPGEPWVLRIDVPDFVVSQNETKSDGRKYFMAKNSRSDVILSATLERVSGHAEIEECQSSLQKRTVGGPFKITNVQAREINGIPVVEYLIPEAEGIDIQQRNFFACMVNADVYIDIHLSKAQFQAKDEALFEAVLKATRIAPTGVNAPPTTGGNARQLLGDGSRAYLQGNFSVAIGPYQQALDLEKKQRTLDQTMTRVLIDNLGMAYGLTGNLAKASEIFDYGVSIDPNYPMFYYNIACVHGEKNDMENAIVYLQKAFANKAHVIPGENMPADDSFTRFMKNDRFVKAVTSLVQSGQ